MIRRSSFIACPQALEFMDLPLLAPAPSLFAEGDLSETQTSVE
jgi:hypothetical protein